MDRGIKDEGFVRKALSVAENDHGRWIANQACFNNLATDTLEPKAHAALVTAVSIFVEKYEWPEEYIEEAINSKTCGEARALVDKLSPMIPS